jgi:DNA-binding beta-propeller fold protein YncE
MQACVTSAHRSPMTCHPSQSCRRSLALYLCLAVMYLTAALFPCAAPAADASAYRVLRHWHVGGSGGWRDMVVDVRAGRLYIARNDRITVLDIVSGSTVGEITGLTDPRGIALLPDGARGYVSDGTSGIIHLFDARTLQLLKPVSIGGVPDELALDPSTLRLFAFDVHKPEVVVLNAKSGEVLGRIPLPGQPAGAVVAAGNTIYVNLLSTGEVARIDTVNLKLGHAWPLSPCVGPSAMAIDSAQNRLFSVCENRMVAVSDAVTGKLIETAPIGEGAHAVAYDDKRRQVFTANGEGSVTVLAEGSPNQFSVLETLKTEPGTRMLALNPKFHDLYVVAAKFGQRPGPTSEELEFRPTIVADSTEVLVIGIADK